MNEIKKDTYQKWEESGKLEEKLKSVQELASRHVKQSDIAQVLGITEKTLIKLKRLHPKLGHAFQYGDEELKNKLIDAMYQRAIGMEYEETQTIIEETKTGTKKRIIKSKKRAIPDIGAIKYLLIIKFGREFNDRKEELDLIAQRIEKGEDVWVNENSDEEAVGVIRVRKQSPK
jgi:predicted transcriptional regulator